MPLPPDFFLVLTFFFGSSSHKDKTLQLICQFKAQVISFVCLSPILPSPQILVKLKRLFRRAGHIHPLQTCRNRYLPQVILEFHDHILAHKGLEKGIEEHCACTAGCPPDREGEGRVPRSGGRAGTGAQGRARGGAGLRRGGGKRRGKLRVTEESGPCAPATSRAGGVGPRGRESQGRGGASRLPTSSPSGRLPLRRLGL